MMKKIVLFLSLLCSRSVFSQTEEVHVFYVDLASREVNFSKRGFDNLPPMMVSKMQQIGDSILSNNGQIIFYQMGGYAVDTIPSNVKRWLKRPFVKDPQTYSFDLDASRIRDILSQYHRKWGRFISLNIHFFLPTDISKKMFEEYNDFRCILLNELGFQNPYSDIFNVNFHVANQSFLFSKEERKKYSPEYFKNQFISFGNYDFRFQQNFGNYSFSFY